MAASSSLAKPPTDLKTVVDEEIKYAILPSLLFAGLKIDSSLPITAGNGTSVSREAGQCRVTARPDISSIF